MYSIYSQLYSIHHHDSNKMMISMFNGSTVRVLHTYDWS